MAKLFSQLTQQTTYYNSAINGGAIGTYVLDIYIKTPDPIFGFWITAKTALLGGSSIAFGLRQTGSATPLNDPEAIMPFTPGALFTVNNPLRSSDCLLVPLNFTINAVVTMTISVAPITSGSLQVDVWIQNNHL